MRVHQSSLASAARTACARKPPASSLAPATLLGSFLGVGASRNSTFEGFIQKTLAHARQTKLAINRPGDEYEQEADRVADEVVYSSKSKSLRSTGCQNQHPLKMASASGETIGLNGDPLDSGTRAFMEARFGHDFSSVRVHTDRNAGAMAQGLSALAFTVGRDIVFGDGQYSSGTQEGQRLLAHELTHTIQQQAGLTSLKLQCAVIDDVREKLSYAWNDWAITDADATEALALLGSIPPADLAKELKRLESKYVTRLLDNLPDTAKTGDVYRRVVQTLGPTGIQPYATEQLSYSFFLPDVVITDAEVTNVFNLFANLPAGEQEQFLANLNTAERLDRLIDNSNSGHHARYIRPWIATLVKGGATLRQKNILRVIVQNTGDDAIETIKLATEVRFKVDVRQSQVPGYPPVNWEPGSLRQTYLTLDMLPEAHVAANAQLLHLGQYKQPGEVTNTTLTPEGKIATTTSTAAGFYSGSRKELAINTEPSPDREKTVIHETGHAVDQKMGWSAGPEPANPKRGGWKSYGSSYHDCADDMVGDSGGAIKTTLDAAQRGNVVDEMEQAMSKRNTSDLETNIRKLPWFAGLKDKDKRSVIADRALPALYIGLDRPWAKAVDGGEHLGEHVYEESYKHDWSRYRHEARSRMLEPYQFRQAPEWFAVAYAFYYLPDPRGKGAKLKDKDPDTKTYFDTTVDTLAPSANKP